MPPERRRERKCPSCGSTALARGKRVDGWAVVVPPEQDKGRETRLAPFSDICRDCGMVTLYVRIGEVK